MNKQDWLMTLAAALCGAAMILLWDRYLDSGANQVQDVLVASISSGGFAMFFRKGSAQNEDKD